MEKLEGLDEIDIRILRTLQGDAKLTTKELAAKVNLSPSPTFERQKRLEREGYIEKYVAVVNPKKVGSGFLVLCNVRLKKHNQQVIQDFMEAVQHIDEVTECYNTSGDFDFLLKVYVRDMEHYQGFVLNTLGVIDSVGQLNSVFVYGHVKHTHSVPIPEKTYASHGHGGVSD